MTRRIGIDTGGTFTDLVLLDEANGEVRTMKVPSTPADPAQAVLEGLAALAPDAAGIGNIVLGTTIATNAALQRRGARVFYITTAGFEDIPFLQRADKPDPYDQGWQRPEPLVARRDCLGVVERIGPGGDVITPLSAVELDRLAARLRERLDAAPEGGDCAIAVNLLFSYANPAHEKAIAAHLAERFPAIPLSLASEVAPIWREYERASTTILDAFTKPLMRRFIGGLEAPIRNAGYQSGVAVMKSNGGRMLAAAAAERPAQLLLSGLAGGVIAGRHYGMAAGHRNVITFDMGGTSTDIGLVVDGNLAYTTEYQMEFGQPVMVPSLDVVTIGAGGGSIAWIDKGGLLRVGPASAGADPGPACYGRGGTEATVTDANLLLGRLGADSLLGGGMAIDRAAAERALARLGAQLGLSAEEAALAVIAVANENMANSIRVLTVDRGLDPSEFALVAFGGAGPLHAAELAAILDIPEIIVPPHPGVTSALGTLIAPPRVDLQRTFVRRGDRIDPAELSAVLEELEARARAELAAEGYDGPVEIQRNVALRYAGQSYEQEVPAPPPPLDADALRALFADFDARHHDFYGYSIPGETMEVTGCAVTATGTSPLPAATSAPARAASAPGDGAARRQVVLEGGAHHDAPVLRRGTEGAEGHGPCVIEGYDSTIFVLPGQRFAAGPDGALILSGHKAVHGRRPPDDPVALSIINNALVAICREMGTAMIRTAYSPIFNESRDFSCAIFDPEGQLLAQGEYCPAQLGAIVHTVRCVLDEIPISRFGPGDVLIHNDPYRGGCHMPEHLMLRPIFHDGKLVAFAAIIAHLAEIGGMVVGSFAATATEVFQEGLRLPPVMLMRGGERVQEVWDIMLANHRTPRHTWGDLHAMLGALSVADSRFRALCTKYGPDYLARASAALLDYAERWMRAEIRAIPDGVYEFADAMEDDGVGTETIGMHVKVTVDGDHLTADFTGSDDQAKGPINATRGVTMSATFNALYQLVDNDIPRNAGCYRAIEVVTRPGSVLDVRYPAPSVGGNTETQPRIVFLVMGALAQALPDRIGASEGGTACNFLIGGIHPDTQEYFAHYHFEASGFGGRPWADGNDCQNHMIGNCRITPVEVFETRFPFRILSYGLKPGSGGAGRFRGGLASVRVMRVEAPEVRVSLLMDRARIGAFGLFGGERGTPAAVTVRRAGETAFRPFTEAFGTLSASKFADVRLRRGDEVRIESAGGGGYGDPTSRDPVLVARDRREGFDLEAAAGR